VRRASSAGLIYLRGRDADGRLRELAGRRARVRPALAELAIALLERRAYEPLGFRSLGDWSRERIGVGARAVREWARVWRVLSELPRLRAAVLAGDVSWTVARKIAAHATPENEEAFLATVRGRSVRAVEILLRAAFPCEPESSSEDERVSVRVPCSPEVSTKWVAAVELARRVAGENLAEWECAEAIAAECASAVSRGENHRLHAGERRKTRRAREASDESGYRALVWPHLSWRRFEGKRDDPLEGLTEGLDECPPRELDRRFRRAIAFLQEVDLEIGRVLKQVVDRKLYAELGFESFERYVEERLDLSPRTARRLVRLARAEHRAAPVANAFREGRITLLQAEVLLRGGTVERAQQVTLRRLEDDWPRRNVEFRAPTEVATLFGALVESVGLEAMLDHAIATWVEAGRLFRDYADFARDGFRCTVPGCSARRNLHSHHIHFRSASGPDEAWNRTTLCAFHHERGVHAGTIGIRGRAPDELIYRLGVGAFRSGDVKLAAQPGAATG
jgi:hypothetical protein